MSPEKVGTGTLGRDQPGHSVGAGVTVPGALVEGALAGKSVKSLGGERGLGKEMGGKEEVGFFCWKPLLCRATPAWRVEDGIKSCS